MYKHIWITKYSKSSISPITIKQKITLANENRK